MIDVSWKEIFARWDELSKKTHAELVDEMGEAWANVVESLKLEDIDSWVNKKPVNHSKSECEACKVE